MRKALRFWLSAGKILLEEISEDPYMKSLIYCSGLYFYILMFGEVSVASDVQIKECPDSPNCVSTQTAQKDKLMEPLSYSGAVADVRQAILSVLNSQARTKLVKDTELYLHFTFTSAVFRFVDDVEFFIDDQNKKVHFRSASRLGYRDFGVNRERMEKLIPLILESLK